MTPDQIGGIMPVLYSFFDHAGRLRQDGFRHQISHCLEGGATGTVLFGFVTQFYRLTFPEKIETIRTAVAASGGTGTVGVTVMEPSPEAQAELIRAARDEGADWVILQPPLGPPARPSDWLEMLAGLIAGAGLPAAIQNADMASTRLSNADILNLQARCPALAAVKAETASEDVAAFAEEAGHRVRVINGNWGVEYPFFRRHGAHGLIPAPNFVPEQVALHAATGAGDWQAAEDIHARILPLMQFLRERPAPEGQVLLGKHAYSWRTGLDAGGNRRPGPEAPDPRILAHARRLWDRLVCSAA